MSSIVNAVMSLFGGGKQDMQAITDAAERQAAETRRAAEQNATQARFTAQAAQIQREGLQARNAAEEKARALTAAPAAIPEVTIGSPLPTTVEEAKRKRNPRKAFSPTADSGLNL